MENNFGILGILDEVASEAKLASLQESFDLEAMLSFDEENVESAELELSAILDNLVIEEERLEVLTKLESTIETVDFNDTLLSGHFVDRAILATGLDMENMSRTEVSMAIKERVSKMAGKAKDSIKKLWDAAVKLVKRLLDRDQRYIDKAKKYIEQLRKEYLNTRLEIVFRGQALYFTSGKGAMNPNGMMAVLSTLARADIGKFSGDVVRLQAEDKASAASAIWEEIGKIKDVTTKGDKYIYQAGLDALPFGVEWKKTGSGAKASFMTNRTALAPYLGNEKTINGVFEGNQIADIMEASVRTLESIKETAKVIQGDAILKQLEGVDNQDVAKAKASTIISTIQAFNKAQRTASLAGITVGVRFARMM